MTAGGGNGDDQQRRHQHKNDDGPHEGITQRLHLCLLSFSVVQLAHAEPLHAACSLINGLQRHPCQARQTIL